MIKVSVGNGVSLQNLPVEVNIFKGGEVNVRLPEGVVTNLLRRAMGGEAVELTANITNSDEAMAMFMTVDALRRIAPIVKINAFIPYLPYARQDRVCNSGEALSLGMFAQLVNAMNFESVSLLDPHSDVAAAAINRSFVTGQDTFLKRIVDQQILSLNIQDLMLVAPDAGAVKKIKALSKRFDIPYVTATKTRNLATMEITETKLDGNVAGKNLIVVDDICDGGRTFIQLGRILRDEGCKELSLFVTHGIFSYGLEPVLDVFDRIYTTDSFHPDCTTEFRLSSDRFVNSDNLRRVHWFNV